MERVAGPGQKLPKIVFHNLYTALRYVIILIFPHDPFFRPV